MPCRSCGSKTQGNFASEIDIHFPGLKGLDMPTVLVFPRLVICLDCGFVEFESRIEKAELSLLEEGLVPSERTKRAEGTGVVVGFSDVSTADCCCELSALNAERVN